jgi:hypothetical protein
MINIELYDILYTKVMNIHNNQRRYQMIKQQSVTLEKALTLAYLIRFRNMYTRFHVFAFQVNRFMSDSFCSSVLHYIDLN